MVGTQPLYFSLALIIEEGLPLNDLEKVMDSIHQMAEKTGVKIVAGDTKIVNHGSADKLFINTTGIGLLFPDVDISGANAKPGDKIIINGPIGDHGVAVLAERQKLRFKILVASDCAPLNTLVGDMMQYSEAVRRLRDPTRGGLATILNEIAFQSKVSICVFEGRIPIRESVQSACAMLGLDPLYVANEGKLLPW